MLPFAENHEEKEPIILEDAPEDNKGTLHLRRNAALGNIMGLSDILIRQALDFRVNENIVCQRRQFPAALLQATGKIGIESSHIRRRIGKYADVFSHDGGIADVVPDACAVARLAEIIEALVQDDSGKIPSGIGNLYRVPVFQNVKDALLKNVLGHIPVVQIRKSKKNKTGLVGVQFHQFLGCYLMQFFCHYYQFPAKLDVFLELRSNNI